MKTDNLIFFLVLALIFAGIIPAHCQLPSPVSTQILSVPRANSCAQGAMKGFPTTNNSFTIEGYVYFPSSPPNYEFKLLMQEGFSGVTINEYDQVLGDTYYHYCPVKNPCKYSCFSG
ncbi:MAG: hypothetical protein L6437_15350 [Kiritimatiellae bacterium]|nr:hypothetical protein [Verrucomicrobiota bacterium]MCG2661609.1 hypothetical protein [Kiritimatiellia bacterium]